MILCLREIIDLDNMESKTNKKKTVAKKCPRCKGVGWRMLTVGPHIVDGGIAISGGKAKYDCRLCRGTGKTSTNSQQ